MGTLGYLHQLAAEEGIELPADAARSLLRHLDMVLERTRSHNLTAILHTDEAIRRHVVDSLVAIAHMTLAPNTDVLDLGTGAGYPGMVLAIVRPDLQVTLLDSTKKKTAFLEECIRELEIEDRTRVLTARAEELATLERNCISLIIARAVAPLPSLVELSSPLLRSGGRLFALKGRVDKEELEWGDAAADECGLRRTDLVRYELLSGGEKRSLVEYVKDGEPNRELPRRTGMAQKRPLGKVVTTD
ncbi:MAG: 16S rRNA (guanine(527)-N(7))-methyltransferase RsmG [Coriobacteriia bacterium]|nr:16S rRNA (guanine(527)-N(7))-methyltransferase RsmG [Coriobacteriia bacterium]